MKIETKGKRENENERPNPGPPLLSIFCEVARQERETQESSVTFRGPTLRIPHKKRVEWPSECARNRAAIAKHFIEKSNILGLKILVLVNHKSTKLILVPASNNLVPRDSLKCYHSG